MAPPMARAELSLSYPIWATDFDPNNSDFLIVGGGGGESRSGVGNKITLIDASKKQTLAEAVDIDLSRDEDSVTSLAVAQSTAEGAKIYAGINSSMKEQEKGKNEHFRSFSLALPVKRKREEEEAADAGSVKNTKAARSQVLGKSSLFRTPPNDKNETYQRVLRLSKPIEGSSARMGGIATGLAPAGEVVVFNASSDAPTENDVLKRIRLDNGQEASDLDVMATESGEFLLAYTTSYEIYVCPVALSGKAKSTDPRLLYQYPIPDVFKNIQRPNFRSLRFLTPRLLAAVINLPDRKGAELLLVDVPSETALEGTVLLRKSFHKTLKNATAFAVSTIPGPTPASNVQHVLAVAGQDNSITILTLDHDPPSNRRLRFYIYTTLKSVHTMQLTSLSLSSFRPPKDPKTALPQLLKLASTGIDSSVIVHTFPLRPYPQPKSGNENKPMRYFLSPPSGKSENAENAIGVVSAVILIGLATFFMQAFLEIRGGAPEWLGAKDWLPERVHNLLARPYIFESGRPEPWWDEYVEGVKTHGKHEYDRIETEARQAKKKMGEAVQDTAEDIKETVEIIAEDAGSVVDAAKEAARLGEEEGKAKAVVITESGDGVSAEAHHDEVVAGENHRKWEDLKEHERKAWKKRLIKAGKWVADEGETVLKGVFFGELAGAVGEAFRG